MADAIQNVRIKFVTDTSGLTAATKANEQLSQSEQDVVRGYKDIDSAAKQTGSTVTNEANKSKKALEDTSKSTGNFGNVLKGIGGLVAGAFAVDQLIQFQKQIIAVTGEFQKYRAVLTNALGDQQQADIAMATLTSTAAKTNFGVQELTSSYIKLVNSGFKPTEAEIFKLADLANSTGKSFDQLTEAIIDAQTGEFERLKEFGIRASKEGDQVKFTFKGVQTQVDFTSQSIQKYILGLGDLNGVSGATEAISKTLTGQISNLGDSYDQLLVAIGNNEAGIISWGVSATSAVIDFFTEMIKGEERLRKEGVDKILGEQFSLISKRYQELTEISVSEGKKQTDAAAEARQTLFNEYTRAVIDAQSKLDRINQEFVEFGATMNAEEEENARLRFSRQEEFVKLQKARLDAVIKLNNDLFVAEKELTDKEKKELQKKYDDQTKALFDQLKQQEDYAIRRAKLDGANEQEILGIRHVFVNKNIALYRDRFSKEQLATNQGFQSIQLTYEEHFQKINELNKKQGELDEKAAQERVVAIKNAEIGGLEDAYAEEKVAYTQIYTQRIEDARKAGKYRDEAIKQAEYQNQKDALTRQIEFDQQKLNVSNLTKDEQIAIEQDLANTQKALYDLDYQQFLDAEKKKTDEAKKAADERKKIEEQAVKTGQAILDAAFQIRMNNIQAETDALNAQKDADLKRAGDNEQAKAQINAKYDALLRQQKNKQAQADRQKAIFDILINTSVAVVKSLPNYILAALVAATGAAQLAVVNSRPVPKYKFGTRRVGGIDTGSDTVHALLRPGESVITTEQTSNHSRLLDNLPSISPKLSADFALNHAKYERIMNGGDKGSYDLSRMENMMKEMSSALKSQPKVNIELTEKGFKKTIQRGNSETEFTNDYFNI